MGFQALSWQLPTSCCFERTVILGPAVIHRGIEFKSWAVIDEKFGGTGNMKFVTTSWTDYIKFGHIYHILAIYFFQFVTVK